MIVNFVVNNVEFSDSEFFIADLNSDNEVNVNDIVLMVQMILSN